MNFMRRNFLKTAAGAGAALGLRRIHPAADAPMPLREMKRHLQAAERFLPDANPVGGYSDALAAYDPVADYAKRIALLKAMPDWYFKDRYGDIGPSPDFRMMKSWKPWFQQQAEFDLHVKGMRRSLITKAKYELKSFLWRKAGKDFP